MHEIKWEAGEEGAGALLRHDGMPQRHLALACTRMHAVHPAPCSLLAPLVPNCSWLDRSYSAPRYRHVWRGCAGEYRLRNKRAAFTAQQVAVLPLSTACCVIMHFPHLISHPPFPSQGLPYAMASQGWALGLCMLALATGASAYSAFLLAEVRAQWAATVRVCMRLLHARVPDWLACNVHRMHFNSPQPLHAPPACAAAHAARRAARAHAARAGRGDLGQARPPLDRHPPAHRHGEWHGSFLISRVKRVARCSPAEQLEACVRQRGSGWLHSGSRPTRPLRACCRAGRRFADLHRRWRHFPYEYY